MAKICYVNAITGNNANTGLSPALAKKTIAGARSATAAAPASTLASPDLVLIAAGVYPEPDTVWNAAADQNVVYMADGSGEVVVDFEQRGGTQALGANWLVVTTVNVIFVGIRFRNVYRGAFPSSMMVNSAGSFIHCVFHQRASDVGVVPSGTAISPTVSSLIQNCSFHNLSIGISGGGSTTALVHNNYFVNTTSPITGTVTRDYNAFPGNTETNGINTSVGANPGFRDATDEDFRLSPTTLADYEAFLRGGRFGGRIAAAGKPLPYYDSRFPQLRMITKVPAGGHLPIWENDPSYVAIGVLGAIIQDPTTNELAIDLASTPTATDGRARSDVYDLGATSPNLANFTVGKFEDLPGGAALDTNLTLPKKWEYRSSAVAFLKTDVSPAWIEVEPDDYINVSNRYVQFRITFVVNHTNA